ncbi:MAG: DNA replication and repair protein RecF [Ruminococcus sp.]|nr:DNA replication and repair protein RecF [Ruminococcus sp.]
MIITYANIEGFRNLSGIEINPDPKYNIISGLNAQGKTNLLEALWIMSGCKSFRSSKEKDYIAVSGNKMTVDINIIDNIREHRIHTEITRSNGNTRNIILNGVKQKGSKALFDVFRCIAFTPDDVDIIKGSPEKRRNFIDMASSQLNPSAVMHLNRHNRILNQRNALLKNIMNGKANPEILSTIDKQTAEEGAYISHMRYGYIRKINRICSNLYRTLSGGTENLEFEYKSNVYKAENLEMPVSQESYGIYFRKLQENSGYDIKTGTTHTGVNRDEILIKINGLPAKEYASQGQIKSTALVMKLAQAEIFMEKSDDSPVIFLDDVMGELDENRQKFIFDIIRNMQVFITTCNESALLPEIKGKIFRIHNGKLIGE